ncbi:hypothetical protein, partial [Iamia sp.]|uniref:hypothetical protein n=1 Tax=Iamia sp. TaxID=2722710 RepID=UPI002D811142
GAEKCGGFKISGRDARRGWGAMPHGGARNRSGPQKDPKSARSDALGVRFGELPRGGYTGRLPAWPLSAATARERTVWKEAWRTPQAAAWSTEPWRHRTVALWVRWTVRMEEPDAPAAVGSVVVRLADQIGLTPAGLRENQWKIQEAPAHPAAAPAGAKVPVPPPSTPSPRDRLRVVASGSGG